MQDQTRSILDELNNSITEKEADLCHDIAFWENNNSLEAILYNIQQLITYATEAARPPQDAGAGGSTQKQSTGIPGQADVAKPRASTEQQQPFGYSADDGD